MKLRVTPPSIMGERKVVDKYYPPDFDPAKLRRNTDKPKNDRMDVRHMLPMKIRCNSCGIFIGPGTKFNTTKVTIPDEDYLGIELFRFYFRCNNCRSQIILRTDPQNSYYAVESGARATRNEYSRVIKDDDYDYEVKDSIEELESKAAKSKREMDVMADLEVIKCVNLRQARVCEIVDVAHKKLKESCHCSDEDVLKLNEEDEEHVRSVFRRKRENVVGRIRDEDLDDGAWGRKAKKIRISDGGFSGSWSMMKSSLVKVIGPKESPARELRETSVAVSALQSLCQNYEDNEDE